MEEISEISMSHSPQKEQERERRRLRDRQRRQSMTLEQRERHLARRRRNYQLRRERAAIARLSLPCIQAGTSTQSGENVSNDHQFENIVPAHSAHASGFVHINSGDGHEVLHEECMNFTRLSIPAHKTAEFRGAVRLTHIKHVARMLHTVKHYSDDKLQCRVDVGAEGGHGTSNCGSVEGLRLNRIKRLARSMKGSGDQDQHCEADAELTLPEEGLQKTSNAESITETDVEGNEEVQIH